MARITGRVEIKVNGDTLYSKAGAVASGIGISGKPNFELTEVMGDGGIHGFVENPVVAKLEVTVSDRDVDAQGNELLLSDLASIREEGTIIFQTAGGTGKVYTMSEATCTRNFSVTAGEGETTLVFVGKHWLEATR